MASAPLPDPSALSPEDDARAADLVAATLASPDPPAALLAAMAALEPEQKPALMTAVYEAVSYRVDPSEYWLQYRMWKAYKALGPARSDAAFFHAANAVQRHPDWQGSGQMFEYLISHMAQRNRDREAVALFRHKLRHRPESAASVALAQIVPILRRVEPTAPELGAPPAAPRPGACRVHRVTEEQTRLPWTCPVFGGAMPLGLHALTRGLTRAAVTVAEFEDAEVLISGDLVVVLDRFGDVHEPYSIGDFPAAVRALIDRQEAAGERLPLHEVDEAVVIADRYPGPNICHTLLDQVTRLALYQRLGVDTDRSLVIGPAATLPAQREILQRAGVAVHLPTDQPARVRARRLWVSSTCRQICHTAHFAADWALTFVHRILRGQGTKGWRRLYLTRGDVATRRVINEAEVIALLESHGFDAITPGHMPYSAQLAAFRQASAVIAGHGAGLTNVAVCPPGTQVLEIFHPLYGTDSYAMLAEPLGLDHAVMIARDWESDAPEWNDPTLRLVEAGRLQERHMRVDLPTLSRYLATLS